MEVRLLDDVSRWLADLRDPRAKAKILLRLRRLSLGNPGDVKPVGNGLSELRIQEGPGYRVYYLQQGEGLALVLKAGTKSTQDADIASARRLAREWKDAPHGP
jgi:putative addiction module killer protein